MKIFINIINWFKNKKLKNINLQDYHTMIKIQKLMENMPTTNFSFNDIKNIICKE